MRRIARMVIVGCALVFWTGLVHAQSGYDLLQRALVEERSNGQVREAIELYRRIISEHASDRALTATALVRLGRAYETLGSQDARQTYERVVSEYADQRDMASEARARLSAIARSRTASAAKTMAARQVWTDPGDFGGRVSPDGRYVSFADWDTGNLAIHDVVTGEDRQITRGGSFSDSENFAEESRWSPDGTQLAYTRYVEVEGAVRGGAYELRLTGVDDLESRLLYRDDDVFYPVTAWSADGKYLAFRSLRGRDDVLVVRVIESGAETVVTREVRVRPGQEGIRWHPDGESLFVNGEYRGRRGVFQVALRTGGAVPEFVNDGPLWTFDRLSADGSTMYRVEPLVRDDRGRVVQSAIIRTDLATGVESELHRDNIGLMALSPDDRTIVFLSGYIRVSQMA